MNFDNKEILGLMYSFTFTLDENCPKDFLNISSNCDIKYKDRNAKDCIACWRSALKDNLLDENKIKGEK